MAIVTPIVSITMSATNKVNNTDTNNLSYEMFSDLLTREDWKPQSIDDVQLQSLQDNYSDVSLIPLPAENDVSGPSIGICVGQSNGIMAGPKNCELNSRQSKGFITGPSNGSIEGPRNGITIWPGNGSMAGTSNGVIHGPKKGFIDGPSIGLIAGSSNIEFYNTNFNGQYGHNSKHNMNGPLQSRSNGVNINSIRPLNGANQYNGYQPHLAVANHGNINGQYIGIQGYMPNFSSKKAASIKKPKRNRTAFTSSQMMELEQEYVRSRYLDRNRRIELAEVLNLNERTIKIWFQNRRMKEKKDKAESLDDSTEISTSESSPDFTDSIPIFVPKQYPVPVTVDNVMYNRGVYMEHNQVSSAPTNVPMTMSYVHNSIPNVPETLSQIHNPIVRNYTEYQEPGIHQNNGPMHLQVQHPIPREIAQVDQLEPIWQENPPVDVAPATNPKENWDLSWIRSLHPEEEL